MLPPEGPAAVRDQGAPPRRLALEDAAFCGHCGSRIRLLFNQRSCAFGCRPKPTVLLFPSFWSAYAGVPEFVPSSHTLTTADKIRMADCVVVFAYTYEPATTPDAARRVQCIKNQTWDRQVGRSFRVTVAEWARLQARSEILSEDLVKRHGVGRMACLRRG